VTVDSPADDELAVAALVGGTDRDAQAIVERELAAAGIECFLEGSVVYGVQVRAADVARAVDVLRSSAGLTGHWIEYPLG
jgi:hypothetical protein